MITFKIVPNNAATFIDLLNHSSPHGRVGPLKQVAYLPKELEEGDFLPLDAFVDLTAYVLQSLEMTREEKREILQKITYIYPLNQDQKSKEYQSYKKLMQIFQRIKVLPEDLEKRKDFLPVGLDSFEKSFTDPSLPVDTINLPSQEKRIEKAEELLEFLSESPIKKHLIAMVLNVLLLEHDLMERIWKSLEVEEAFDRYHQHIYGFGIKSDVTTLIRISAEQIQKAPKEGNIYETASIETISELIKKKKSLDALQKETSFIQKNLKKGNALEEQYCLFLESLKEKEKKIELKNDDENIGPFLNLSCFLKKREIRDAISAFFSLDLTTQNPYIPTRIAPFLALQTKWREERLESIEALKETYALKMNLFDFNQKDYQLCKLYEEELECQKKIYTLFYEAFKKCPLNKKNLGSSQVIFNHLPQKIIPQELPPLKFSSFLPCHQLLLYSYEKLAKEEGIELPIDFNLIKKSEHKKEPIEDLPLKKEETSSQKISKKKSKKSLTTASNEQCSKNREEEKSLSLLEEEKIEENPIPQTLHLPSHPPFDYHERTKRWLHHQAPLPKELFSEYSHYPIDYQRKMQIFHGFSFKVDLFVQEYGHYFSKENEKTKNIDRCYAIPGEIQIDEEKHRGIFYYAIGLQNKLYHRFFSQKKTIEMIEIVNKAFYDEDFPSIETPFTTPEESSLLIQEDRKEKISQDPISSIITIENKEDSITIKLIPLNES